jgi:1-acyl-sn-glycerol-3-phosphate acyltransferase
MYAKAVSFYCRVARFIFNIKVDTTNMPPVDQPFLLVGNHLGILDIFVLSSVRNCLFITSVEMRDTPFLGTLCEMGGCFFVERRSRSNISSEIQHIREALKQGFNIVLYPEGTSTNGERVLPFKKSLMTAAAGTGVSILPMALNYTSVNGEPMSWKWRNQVCWYGDQTFLPAMRRLLSCCEVTARIDFLQPIECHSDEERRHVAENAQTQIEQKFVKIPLGPNEVSDFRLPKALLRNEAAGSISAAALPQQKLEI